jgi:ferrous iron transport protein A
VDLCEARIGCRLRVRSLTGHGPVCNRLREMGLCEFAEIEKIADNGALICHVCGARVALSRSLGKQIMVEPLATE